MSTKKKGSFDSPIKFSGSWIDVVGKITVTWEVTETKDYATSTKVEAAMKEFLKKKLKTLEDAAKDLDSKINDAHEKRKEQSTTEGQAVYMKVAADLQQKHGPQLESFVNGTVADGNKFALKWCKDELAKDKKAKGLTAKAVFKGSVDVK